MIVEVTNSKAKFASVHLVPTGLIHIIEGSVCVCVSVCLCVSVSVSQSCLTLCNPIDCSQAARLLHPWNSPGKGTGVGSHSLIHEIFLAQGSNLGLLHCRHIFYKHITIIFDEQT